MRWRPDFRRLLRVAATMSLPWAILPAAEVPAAEAPAAAVPATLTPGEAVTLALRYNPSLRAAGQEVAAAEADRSLARSGYLPRLDLVEDYARSTNPVFVFASKLGQQRFAASDFALDALNRPDPFTNATTRLALRQSLWDAGRTRLGSRAASLGIEAATGLDTRTRDEVAFGALRAFWNAVLADEMLKVASTAEEAGEANFKLAGEQVDAGVAVPSDRMSAEVRLAEIRALRIRAQQEVRVARAALRQALGLVEDHDFQLSPPEVTPLKPEGEEEARVKEALASRPDLVALERRLAQADVGVSIARSHLLPEVGIGAQYEWNGTQAFSGDGSNWSVAASVRLPVFDGLETRARVVRARADRARLQALRDAQAEGIRLEVRAAWADAVGAAERLGVADSALQQAEEALRIVRERYGEGMAVIVELLGAEAARTASQGNRVTAVRDQALALASLDLATGRPVQHDGAPGDGPSPAPEEAGR